MQDKNQYSGNPLKVDDTSNGPFIPNTQQDRQSNSQMASKDLSMIEDLLNHEALAYKKWTVFAGYLQDEGLSDMASSAAAHHKQHFEALQSYMQRQK